MSPIGLEAALMHPLVPRSSAPKPCGTEWRRAGIADHFLEYRGQPEHESCSSTS
jgi:hypothetical protein